jgi:hypothetical protein
VVAPLTGVVTVTVEIGEKVDAGQRVATVEAMKMESSINAPIAGTVERIASPTAPPSNQGRPHPGTRVAPDVRTVDTSRPAESSAALGRTWTAETNMERWARQGSNLEPTDYEYNRKAEIQRIWAN